MNVCEMKQVQKRYGKKVVLDAFDLTIKDGEFVALTGPSGSGKTTILNILGMFERPDRGSVKLFDEEFTPKKMKLLLREKVSYLFQNFALIDNETIESNLEVALAYVKGGKTEKKARMRAALKTVGLGEMPLEQRIFQLSGGEQQRVALARIILKPSQLILADEPTGSLDEENRNAVLETLKKLNDEGRTIVIVTHDPHVAALCHRTIYLS